MPLLLAVLASTNSALRLDAALVQRGLCTSRTMAKSAISGGHVTVDGAVVTKATHKCDGDAVVLAVSPAAAREYRYVSRAGDKLRAALDAFQIDPAGASVLDIGASTGGFTDCLLDAGAATAVCVDCGHGQLSPKLAGDARVASLEGVNARNLTASQLPLATYEFIVVDVSFISLLKVLPALWPLLDAASPRARLVALVKPQFEVGTQLGEPGRRALNKGKGVLADEALQLSVLDGVADFGARELDGCAVLGSIDSPIKGGDGNREFLISLGHAAHAPSSKGPFVVAGSRPPARAREVVGDGADDAEMELGVPAAAAGAVGTHEEVLEDALRAVDVRRRGQTAASRMEAHKKRKRKGDPDPVS